ncbi:hypothetical protein P8452_17321 [Trifolium repens]|nr:basic blue protein [Trifolium repens]WJX28626.1 hypothetical protein P8452_17321 [Trifolium repens]
MGEGRCSASVILMLLCLSVFHSIMICADTHIVGDNKGWSFGVQNWTAGKTFKAGDILVFKYTPVIHNVVVVDESHYNSCSAFGGSHYYFSGSTNITLAKGANYFICGTPGHCTLGMKIAVNAN